MYLASFLDIMPLLLVVKKVICQLEASVHHFATTAGKALPVDVNQVYDFSFATASLPLFEKP